MASCNVHCLVYQQERECLIAGCADGAVRLHFLDGRVPTYNDMPLPTVLQGSKSFLPADVCDLHLSFGFTSACSLAAIQYVSLLLQHNTQNHN